MCLAGGGGEWLCGLCLSPQIGADDERQVCSADSAMTHPLRPLPPRFAPVRIGGALPLIDTRAFVIQGWLGTVASGCII